MATTLATQIQATIQATLRNVQDLVTGEAPLLQRFSATLTTGTGAGQADTMWSDTRTVTTGATDSLDFAGGGLVDAFGVAFAPARIKAIAVYARAANATNLTLGGDANAVPIFGDPTDTFVLKPGGVMVLIEPGATGWAVGAGADRRQPSLQLLAITMHCRPAGQLAILGLFRETGTQVADQLIQGQLALGQLAFDIGLDRFG